MYGKANVQGAHPGHVVLKGLGADVCLGRAGRAEVLLAWTLAGAERDETKPRGCLPKPASHFAFLLKKGISSFYVKQSL